MSFLFWLFLFGIIVASFQDLKRREVDNWLNLFLLVASFSYLFFRSFLENNFELIFVAGFSLVFVFILANLFYHGRVFAGGDSKLLFAMTAFFVSASFYSTLLNIGIFVVILMISGSVYGIGYSVYLYFRNVKKVNREMFTGFRNLWVRYTMITGIIFFVLSYINMIFLFPAVLLLFLPLFYVFAKGVESVSMIRSISGGKLREGDWLVDDVRVGRRVIRAGWGGLNKEDLKILLKKKRVKIKEGIPFVPAFLIAFLIYFFFRIWIFGFLLGFF